MKPFFTEADCDITEVSVTWCGRQSISVNKANRLLQERGRQMYLRDDGACGWSGSQIEQGPYPPTHKGVLISITPIEQDSAESLLKELIAETDSWGRSPDKFEEIKNRAKKLLENK